MSAFGNDPVIKSSLLSRLKEETEERAAFPSLRATQDEFVEWGEQYGLPGAFTLLMVGLSRGREGYDLEAIAGTLNSVKVGADLSAVAYQWMIWRAERTASRWRGEAGFEALVKGTGDFCSVIARAAAGDIVQPSAWRAVRKSLAEAKAANPDEAPYVSIIEAGAWDMQLMPGAISDVLTNWTMAGVGELRKSSNWWGSDEEAAANDLASSAAKAAREIAGPQPEKEDVEAVAQWRIRMNEIYAAENEKIRPNPLIVRAEAEMTSFMAAQEEDQARRGKLGLQALNEVVKRAGCALQEA